MAEHQEKPSNEIKVSIEGGLTFIDHSDAYKAGLNRFLEGEKLSRKEYAENKKMIEFEELQIEAAKKDPIAFIKQQEAKLQTAEVHPTATLPAAEPSKAEAVIIGRQDVPALETQKPAQASIAAERLTDAERLERARQAFAEAGPADRAIAQKNLDGVQDVLAKVPYMTQEFLVQAQQKAFVDEGQKLYERNIAANRKDNSLTWEVANFSQAPGKTLVNGDVGVDIKSGDQAYGVSVAHGINAKAVGLDLAQINAAAGMDNHGAATADVGVKVVKQIHESGDHHVFLAGAADAKISGLESDAKLGGTATGLVVNTHQLAGRPTSEIIGAVVDLQTGSTTAVGSVSTTFNADTQYATTARAVGTYGVETGAGGFSLETYQKTGIDKLTARLSAGVDNVGGTNDVSVGAGVSLGF